MSAPSDGASPPPSDADPDPSRSLFARQGAEGSPDLLSDDLLASVQAERVATSSRSRRGRRKADGAAKSDGTAKPSRKARRARSATAAAAGGAAVVETTSRRSRPHRSWGQRLLISFNIALVLICFISAAGMTYVKRQIADVKRIDLGVALTAQANTGDPQNFLMVGIDNDYGLGADDPAARFRDATLNTDTIMILRIEPSTRRAWILSLQRDLYVPIAGTGSSGRINTALSSGGPGKLIDTIKADFGITINHYVQVDFAGFEQLVDTLGGVPVYFDKEGRDTHSGLPPTGPGCVTLDGPRALQFARSRYYEVKQGPYSWIPDPSSDLGRVARQQEFIRAAMKKAIDRGARNPFTLSQLIGVAQKSVQLDYGVTTQTLLDLGDQFRDFDPDALQVMQPPVIGGFAGAASVLFLNAAQAQPMFDIFRGVDPTLSLQKAIRVTVRSGGGTLNRARQVRDDLGKDGFTAQADENPLYKSDTTIIKFAVGPNEQINNVAEVQAWILARFINGPVTVQRDPTITGDYPFTLTVGSDWQGVRELNNPRPLSDFKGQLPPALEAAGNQPQTATTVPLTLPPTTISPDVPAAGLGADCH